MPVIPEQPLLEEDIPTDDDCNVAEDEEETLIIDDEEPVALEIAAKDEVPTLLEFNTAEEAASEDNKGSKELIPSILELVFQEAITV